MDCVRQSLRALRSQPAFAAFVVTALGLGIGANCALFLVVNSLLLRPLPFRNVGELIDIQPPQRRMALEDLRQAKTLDGVAGFLPWGFQISGNDGVRNVYGNRVSANLFRVLGVDAALGRTFVSGDEQRPVVMMSYEYWRQTSGDPAIIGKTIAISGENYMVIGVTPPDFWLFVRDANLFVPNLQREGRVVARLNSGASVAQARAEVTSILSSSDPRPAAVARRETAEVAPLAEAVRRNDPRTILLLQATVALVLLITCANVANLLLVRATMRRREFAVRTAIGASRAQLLGQLLMEGALLGIAGGALGLLFARWSRPLLEMHLPGNFSRALRGEEALGIDWRVLLFTTGLSLLTVLLFSLAPALSALRFDITAVLRDSARGFSVHRQRMGRILVIAEVALAVMLLVGAGLTLKSLSGLQNQYLGFSADRVMRVAVDLLPTRYPSAPQRTAAFDEIVRRVGSLPGVEDVGVLAPQFFPFGGPRVRGARFEIRGKPDAEARAEVYTANAAYFRAVKIPLLKGRPFSETDTATAAPVALISEIVARRYWGSEDPVGRQVRLNADQPDSPWVTVVGVVGDVRNPVGSDVQPTAYRPAAQNPGSLGLLMIRTSQNPMLLSEAVRRELRSVDPTTPFRPADLEKAVRDYVSPQRFTTSLLGVFALAGLLLAALGIYGVIRFWVASRIPEIGIRMALGADRRSVLWLVLGRAASAAAIGMVVGGVGAVALRRVIASELHGVSPTDPAVLVSVTALMGLVAISAAIAPARWAAKVDPAVALRNE